MLLRPPFRRHLTTGAAWHGLRSVVASAAISTASHNCHEQREHDQRVASAAISTASHNAGRPTFQPP